MTCFRKALAFCVLSGGLVAASTVFSETVVSETDTDWLPPSLMRALLSGQAQAQSLSDTEFEFEADVDVLLALGELHAAREPVYVDLRLKGRSETLLESGWRFGVEASVSAQSGDGRRGHARSVSWGPDIQGQAVVGALSGLHGSTTLDPADARVSFERAELYLQTQWQTWRLGLGQTAARLEGVSPLTALRLAKLDGPGIDPSGLNLGRTNLSFASGAPTLSVQSRRIIGFRASASYSTENTPCFEGCSPAGRALPGPRLEQIWSVAGSFDRRLPSSGVRWQAGLGIEQAQADFQPSFWGGEDPWLVSAYIAREHEGLSVSLSGLIGREGVLDQAYHSVSATVSYELEDWLVSVEALSAQADLVESDSQSVQLGASRFVGQSGLAGFALRYSREDGRFEDREGFLFLLETGLRF